MVLLSNVIALFFLCLVLGIFILLVSKKKTHRVFGFLPIFISGIFLISAYDFTAENLLFIALGMLAFLLLFIFQMRDSLEASQDESESEDEKND